MPAGNDAFVVADARIPTMRHDVADAEAEVKAAEGKVKAADAKEKLADAKVELAEAKEKLAEAKVNLAEAKVNLAEAKVKLAVATLEGAETAESKAKDQLKAARLALLNCSTGQESEWEMHVDDADTTFQTAQSRKTRALDAYNAADKDLNAAQKLYAGAVDVLTSLQGMTLCN